MLASLPVLGADSLPDWELVWSDEFDGPGLNSAKWGLEVDAKGGGNNELQWTM